MQCSKCDKPMTHVGAESDKDWYKCKRCGNKDYEHKDTYEH